MENSTLKKIQEGLFTERQLIEKALSSKGFELAQEKPFYSKPIITCDIAGDFLVELQANGFEWHKRADGVITLSDEKSETSGCYWNFRRSEEGGKSDDLKLSFGVSAIISQFHRGIILRPLVLGTFLSAVDHLSQKRAFEIMAKFNRRSSIIQEIVESDGQLIVNWGDVSLEGIRSIRELFKEFSSGKEGVIQLSNSHLSPFSLGHEKAYLPEFSQYLLFDLWKEQLSEFKNRL